MLFRSYYMKNRFPDINFYHEPISHDGGTAIGLAKLGWYNHILEDYKKSPQTSIYYGPEYKLSDIQKVLDDNLDIIKYKKVTYKDVATLLANKNIVAMYQGRSEAGPRALGNRSILYDPTDPNGKDYVNTVKIREWFRPFAGTVLKEKASDWFEMSGQIGRAHV
mgnify:CR=1 FL=1